MEGGIAPESWLRLRSRVWRFGRRKIPAGISAVKRLLVREMTLRFRREASWGGIGPVTMPAKRMSWLSSESCAMAGERVPARPGEPERPVPSVRMVTREEEEEEQVTPAKEEQGSTKEEKFQEEKKRGAAAEEEGTSVREFLIRRNAAKSVGWMSEIVDWIEMKRKEKTRGRNSGALAIFERERVVCESVCVFLVV